MGDINPVAIVGIWAFFAFLGAAVGKDKGNANAGFLLGLLLGPIGVVIAACLSDKKTKLDLVQARPVAAGWHQDPLGRFSARYYDGARWTQHVGRVDADGTRQQFEDPL